MRNARFVTMLDPFQVKYGRAVTVSQSLVSLLIDVTWIPATLTALGTSSTLGDSFSVGLCDAPCWSEAFVLIPQRHFFSFYLILFIFCQIGSCQRYSFNRIWVFGYEQY